MSTSHRSQAFTLVEILIVVVILGILAALVVPQFSDAAESTRQVSFVTDMRTFQKAAILFTQETGEYLEDSGSGALPAGFDAFINEDKWLADTPLGGVWDAELDSFGFTSGFGVHFQGVAVPDDTYMTEVDRMIDDGNLATGGFQKIAADRFYFILVR